MTVLLQPPHWTELSRCLEVDPEIFFPEKGGSTREAKQVCGGCEVRAECLAFALETNERFGVYGGMSERERRRLTGRSPALTAVEPATEGERVCTKCGPPAKPMIEFGVDRNLPRGRKRWCKACFAAWRAVHEVAA